MIYCLLYLYLKAWLGFFALAFGGLVVFPLGFYLYQKGKIEAAKIIFVLIANSLIYVSSLTFFHQSGSEYYYLSSVTIAALVLWQEKKWVFVFGFSVPLFFWLLTQTLGYSFLPEYLLLHGPPLAMLRVTGFFGAFSISLVVLYLFTKNIYQLNENLIQEEQKSRQSAKLATLGEMSASMAHEINNPLTIISGSISILDGKSSDLVAKEKALARIKKSIQRISKITNGLNKFSRISDTLELREVSIDKLLQECTDLMLAKSTSFQVPIKLANIDKTVFKCDEIQIQQVIVNLISNGIDENKNRTDEVWVELSTFKLPNSIQIVVRDSGQGIDAAIVPKLFDPFFTTKEIGSGTGLGLSISYGIIEKHSGKLEYQMIGGHTAFTVTLPIQIKSVKS
ncbi:MAG: HAMP domain-containing histidine kinase [Bdellovibrionales bacterium]|nr:HAMP domain-containing histidine kinase [Bdellovibrionales bacterium]MBT3524764.1 HAMP domain-containing histidine kinase [Bdellovibrionales bacterium]MBT7669268.1 HAMP domain-containing histidine kinase [Bdellovibrionales bacterium]